MRCYRLQVICSYLHIGEMNIAQNYTYKCSGYDGMLICYFALFMVIVAVREADT